MSKASPLLTVDNSDKHWKGPRYLSDRTEIAEPLHDIRLKVEKPALKYSIEIC